MTKGYWIAQVDVRDPDGYGKYSAALPGLLRRFGGRFTIRGGRTEAMEGSARSRLVVVEFPTYEDALSCYRSPDYARLIALRQACADADLVVAEGWDGAQL